LADNSSCSFNKVPDKPEVYVRNS